jgi:hypothetical protein
MFLNLIFVAVISVIAFFIGPLIADTISVGGSSALFAAIGAVLVPWLNTRVNSDDEDTDYDDDEVTDITTLYVGNLPYRANESAVKDHFSSVAAVSSVRLMRDRRTGKRKGFGFVEVASKDADRAVNKLNDAEFQERTLKVRLAKERVTDGE